MTKLFITKFLNADYHALKMEGYILTIPYITSLVMIVIDLVAGIWKAKQVGEFCTSEGLRRTVAKFREYYSMLITATVVDVLLSVVELYHLPFVTFGAGIYIVIIEGLSIREKAANKEHRRKNNDIKALISVLENRGDLVKTFTEIIKREIDNVEANNGNEESSN